jgi:tetratricopeptide (TPR) repeat protein
MLRNVPTIVLVAGFVGWCAIGPVSAEPSSSETIDLAITLAGQARKTEDRAMYDRVLALLAPLDTPDNTDSRVPFWEAVALRHLKRLDQSIAKYALANLLSPNDVWILNDWGLALSDMKQEEQAIEKFHAAIGASPQNAWPYNNLGRSLNILGRYAEAEPYLRTAVALDPQWAHAQENLGRSLRGQGKYDEALTHLRIAVQLEPRSASKHHALAACLAKMKQWEQALQAGQQAVDLDEIDPFYQDFVGWVLAQMGRFTDALPYAKRAVNTEPANFVYRYNLAFIQDKLHHYSDLVDNAREMIRLQSQNADGYACLGWAQIGKWQFSAAQGNFHRAHELDPNNPNYQRGLDEAQRKMWALYAGIIIVIALLVLRFRRWQQRHITRPPDAKTPPAQ